MRFEEQFNILGQCFVSQFPPSNRFSEKDILSMVTCSSLDVRVLLAKTLVFEENVFLAAEVLCKLAIDTNEIVRSEAMDTLSSFPCEKGFEVFCAALNDNSEIVRFYAFLGVGYVGKHINPEKAKFILQHHENLEHSQFAIVGLYEGLYVLGITDALNKIFSLFENDDYHIQCAVLNSIEEILTEDNADNIKAFLYSLDEAVLQKATGDTLRRIKDTYAI